MKKIINPFTESEIKLIKNCVKINYLGKKHGFSTRSNHIYRIMRSGVKNEKSKSYPFLKELREILTQIQANNS